MHIHPPKTSVYYHKIYFIQNFQDSEYVKDKDLTSFSKQELEDIKNNLKTKSNVEITATNIDNLADFCTNKKQDANVDKVKLFRFYEYYLNKLNNGWTGNFNVEQLWNNWIKPKTN